MRIYNRYILLLVGAACIINTLLAFLEQQNLNLYFIVNTLVFLVITFLFTYMNPRARRTLTTVGSLFFAGFVIIIVIELVNIVAG